MTAARTMIEALRRLGARVRRDGDEGFSLVEMMVSMVTLGILTSMVYPVVTSYTSAGARIEATYSGIDQILPVGTTVQHLVRSAVEPAGPLPSTSPSIPVPAFGNATLTGGSGYASDTAETVSGIGECSLTFFTNIGDPNGPAEITATVTPSAGGPCTSTAVTPAGGWTFTVTETRADGSPDTCPIANPPGSTPPATLCTYPATSTETLLDVTGVVNDLDSAAAGYRPVLRYTYVKSSVGTSVPTGQVTSTFDGSCTAASCPAAAIQSVGVDLQVQETGGQQVEDDTVVYTLSPISSEYDPSVG